jgi:hypothetical protein
MKYMIQVRFDGSDAVIRGLSSNEQNKITTEFQAVRALPGVLDGNQLEPPSTAKTIRVNDGQTLVSEGPAVDHGAAINGYYILDAPDLDTAIAFAARNPVARMGGTVEVRALMERQ